jgi:hypothetical protein
VRWVAKRELNGLVGRWVAKLVPRLLATAALWVRNHDISQKYKMGDISKGVDNTLWPAKKNTKKRFVHYLIRPLEHYQTTF